MSLMQHTIYVFTLTDEGEFESLRGNPFGFPDDAEIVEDDEALTITATLPGRAFVKSGDAWVPE